MKRVLMIAYHFPPLAGSSGIQRTLRFVQQLPQFGWQPIVLTAQARAYEKTGDDLLAEVPADTVVCRAFALDAARHLSVAGRYPGLLARPDRWVSWRFDAVRQGLRLIRLHRPQAIWSTYPIATAHMIGAALRHRSRLPWVADFRDPMAQEGYPQDPRVRASFVRIEEMAAQSAAMCVFATPGALREYQRRYPHASARMVLLENGYDEASFAAAEATADRSRPLNPGMMTLLHSGIVYPQERDPGPLFKAVATLVANGSLSPSDFRLRFRAPVHEALLRQLAQAHRVSDVVEILPAIPYRDALVEMLRADGLLVLQSNNCNDQVPAKLYEYFRTGRPVLCLADPSGDTARVCLQAGLPNIAAMEDSESISTCLAAFADEVRQGVGKAARRDVIQAASRQQRSAQLVRWLDALPTPQREMR